MDMKILFLLESKVPLNEKWSTQKKRKTKNVITKNHMATFFALQQE